LKDIHSISAVLTTLNYVCQCVETSASLSVISLCAAATVIANTALSHGNFDQASQQQLVSCCSSFDAIVRGHSKFSTIILRCGMLQYLIISPLKQFHDMAIGGQRIDRKYVPIYDKIIDLMIVVFRRNPSAQTRWLSGWIPPQPAWKPELGMPQKPKKGEREWSRALCL
jgi:hypothetical protein